MTRDGGRLLDLSVSKVGRSHFVTIYYDPERKIGAEESDQLNLALIREVRQALPSADVTLIITQHPRRWPDELWPG